MLKQVLFACILGINPPADNDNAGIGAANVAPPQAGQACDTGEVVSWGDIKLFSDFLVE